MEKAEKSDCTQEKSNNQVIHLSIQKTDLASKIKRKMKKYKITSFHFILDEKKENEKEEKNKNNTLSPKGKEENEKSLKISDKLYQENKQESIIKTNINPNDNNLQNEVNNKKGIDTNIILDDNNNNINECERKIDNSSKKNVEIIITNEEDDESNNNINNSKFLGKKTNNSNKEILNSKEIEVQICKKKDKSSKSPKDILFKLIKKYSYQMIFNIFLKFCSKKKRKNDKYYNKEIYEQIKKLIKDIGIQNVMQIILNFGNLSNEQIKYSNDDNINEEEIIVIEDNSDNNDKILEEVRDSGKNNIGININLNEEIDSNKNIEDDNNENNYDKKKNIKKNIYDLLYMSFN